MQDFNFYFGLGWHHIISKDALDHQLFIMALVAIYAFREWKQVLILVTAFTIGHSLTLALSVLDIIRFPNNWVEFLIPCTIVFTAIANLFHKKGGKLRLNYLMALLFGFIHGMGFANYLRFMLARDQSLVVGLFGFNVGLEVGQITVVFILLIIAQIAFSLFKVNRRDWIIFISAGVFSIALKMALDRIHSL